MRITKTVGQYMFGAGTISALNDVLEEPKSGGKTGVVYFVDHFFEGSNLIDRLPVGADDQVVLVNTTDEPTTDGVDVYVDTVKQQMGGNVAAVVGVGGGATLDTAKAVSNLLSNEGKASDYQGWDLLPNPGVFKVGIPTLSGTGAEGSRTCVMMNQEKNLKLGMNSDFTVYDRLILDPDLTESVPREQYFYTGMDTYIHCIESLSGSFKHAMADAYSHQALELCREVFLSDDMQSAENREKLMIASYMGGSAIGNSFVGVVHPFSAGLSMVFHTHHCIGNCIVMNAMDDFYGAEVVEFRNMLTRQGITLPQNVCGNLTETQWQALYDSTVVHEKPLINALGNNFKSILTSERVRDIFAQM